MKTPQILKYAFVLILLVVLFPACVDPEFGKAVQNTDKETDYIAFQSKFVGDAIRPTNNETAYQLCGNSATCNIAGVSPSMRICGLISNVGSSGEFKITEGELSICNESTNCKLLGYFEGTGGVTESGFKFFSEVTVNYGVGGFRADSGKLQLVIKGERIPEMLDKLNYQMMVYGTIEHEVE